MDNREMNEPVIPHWFMAAITFFALAQTVLLCLACVLIRVWAGNLNRKLHRIESNTRHSPGARTPEKEVLGKTGDQGA